MAYNAGLSAAAWQPRQSLPLPELEILKKLKSTPMKNPGLPKLPASLVTSCLLAACLCPISGQEFSRADKLRGSVTPERAWWDILHYDLKMRIFPETRELSGTNRITFQTLKSGRTMQIDLQEPLAISRVTHEGKQLEFTREGNAHWIQFGKPLAAGKRTSITVHYGGKPVESKNPPWSGGLSWQKDKKGEHFIATSCQGIGASIWWPCKDHGYDEPDNGMKITVTVPETLTAVANGRLEKTEHHRQDKTRTFHWMVTQPINNYCVNLNIGNYVHIAEKFTGEAGDLDMDYWVLKHHREEAIRQFVEAPRTIEAFEYWFGPYPFYEDSYKLVQVPYLGMEHQSSVTYGNGFRNGYRGRDLSGTGVGLKFDFIIVHETGHEWFGNNVSMKDAADMWIHESFTNYSENLFVEYHFTRKEAEDYVIGCRKLIKNDQPIIGTYNVNRSGSGDMYYKGGNMLHTIRHCIDNDIRWRKILRGINRNFWHQTVTTGQIEEYISRESGIDFGKVFDQYLRQTEIPELVYSIKDKQITFQFENCVEGFSMPVRARVNGQVVQWNVTNRPQTFDAPQTIDHFAVDRNFYIGVRDRSLQQ
ncbi:MAG: M1 family metallopeptidase [Planctomycetota bacterium]|nr:M1 family metallopeptidase [Planctomycetota bacterium]